MKAAVACSFFLLAAAARPAPLVVKASPVTRPCLAEVVSLFQRQSGHAVSLEGARIGSASSAAGADVVVAVEEELTRVIEGGASAPDLDLDVATIPWVLVGAGTSPSDLKTLARSNAHVRVLGGSIGRHARESLAALPPTHVRTVRTPGGLRNLDAGELALLPLSLAPAGPVSATDVAPLSVRALGTRAGNTSAAHEFLAFLAKGPGNSAFRACGREAGR